MFKKNQIILFSFLMISMVSNEGFAQTRTVGLFLNDTTNVFKGYTLFAPKQYTSTYLINNEGRIIHQWTASKYPPGQTVYLLENGHLLRSCMTTGSKLSSGGGEGGRIEEYDWDDNLVWQLDFATDNYMQHHDFKQLPNGNIIMLVIEKKTLADCLAAGFNPAKYQDVTTKGYMVPDYVAEVKPAYPIGGTVVWEWHTWDHLIQDFDATKSNYGVVKSHPELVDCDGDGRNLPSFWNHMNSIDYNPALDQIALSVRGNSEVWIIDHSTTSAEAKSHTGGTHGKGGDLLYRWGNPVCYGAGNSSNERYFQQHDVEWIKPGNPGAGNMTCFNNGLGRGNYSTVDEFTPAVDANGNYSLVAGMAFAPVSFVWTYRGSDTYPMYAEDISGAYRLPNGNTIICIGTTGEFREVTATGEIVWRYICPVQKTGVMTQGTTPDADATHIGETMNSVFRVYKYPLDYPAFTSRSLIPGDLVEKYTTTSAQTEMNQSQEIQAYPNPFTSYIFLKNSSGKEDFDLINLDGQSLWKGEHIDHQDFSGLGSGIYLLKVNDQQKQQTIKLIKVESPF